MRIEPDFQEKAVKWTIPNITIIDTTRRNVVSRSKMDTTVPLNRKVVFVPLGIVLGRSDQPKICIGILSDNQASPVFVLGCRVLSDLDLKRKGFKAPWVEH